MGLVTALGVVYGDIGTSPLYVFPALTKAVGPVDAAGVLGCLSLVFWALIIIVTVKYALFVSRADNRGEVAFLP